MVELFCCLQQISDGGNPPQPKEMTVILAVKNCCKLHINQKLKCVKEMLKNWLKQ